MLLMLSVGAVGHALPDQSLWITPAITLAKVGAFIALMLWWSGGACSRGCCGWWHAPAPASCSPCA